MSRQIPIIVEPGYETNSARNQSRRGSEPINSASFPDEIPEDEHMDEAAKSFLNANRFQRRHSETPSSTSWKTSYHRSPSLDEERLKRRGSVPVHWNRPPGSRRDRFEDIVEQIMTADDDELLNGFMQDRFASFHMNEGNSVPSGTNTGHGRVKRSPSAPDTSYYRTRGPEQSPFGINRKTDKNGYIEIPIEICQNNENETNKNEEKGHENASKFREIAKGDKIEGESSEMKEEAVQTDDGELEVKITVDSATETEGPNIVDKPSDACAKQSSVPIHEDELKLSHIRDIEDTLKQTHIQVEAFHAANNKDSSKEYLALEDRLMKALMSLDAVQANGSTIVREARKTAVKSVQEDLHKLESKRFHNEQR